jgi:RNA polymerase sigma-70 factor (ECF subfamily)
VIETLRDDDASRLAREFRDGREEAFPELVELLRERLYRVAYRLTGSADDALDVVQDAFVKVYKDIGAWNERSAFYSWLYRVATNLAIDKLRRRKKDREIANGVARERPDAGGDNVDELIEARATQHDLGRLAAAVAALPEGQRVVVTLRHYEGLSLKEIADLRGIALGTVKSTLHQAFRNLQRLMGAKVDTTKSEVPE